MANNRGGLGGGRGRGGSFVGPGGGGTGRGGATGGQPTGPANRHGQRNFGNKDFHNRRGGGSTGGGGSFNSGSGGSGFSHQGSGSFRGRNQGHAGGNRGNRNDGGSGNTVGSKDGTMSSSFGGKKDENRRTLTDFKIIGLAIPELGWTWGTIPSTKVEESASNADGQTVHEAAVKEEEIEESKVSDSVTVVEANQLEVKPEVTQAPQSSETETAEAKPSQDVKDNAVPPSRIRIYFHTPVTADDARPIPHNSTYGDAPSDTRKGKRKKLEDDDGDLEDVRARPPPPQMAGVNDDRASVAGSVAPSVDTASEADWLMAAIVEGEEETRTAADLHPVEEEDEDQLHVSQIVKDDEHDVPEGDDEEDARGVDETLFDGKHARTVDEAAVGVKAPLLFNKRRLVALARTLLTRCSL